tara:strand:- start:166 stop:387 length:222 start_codon:yes stop_codon:yes gene_type:complete
MIKKLKLGDKVIARFLGDKFQCEIIKVVDKDTYHLLTKRGTTLPSIKLKDKCERDKKGNIISPWYIEMIKPKQ